MSSDANTIRILLYAILRAYFIKTVGNIERITVLTKAEIIDAVDVKGITFTDADFAKVAELNTPVLASVNGDEECRAFDRWEWFGDEMKITLSEKYWEKMNGEVRDTVQGQ